MGEQRLEHWFRSLLAGSVAAGALLVVTDARGANRYVNLAGVDLFDCAEQRPGCASIGYAVQQANPGDTVVVDRWLLGLIPVAFFEDVVTVDKEIIITGVAPRNGRKLPLLARSGQRHFHVTSSGKLTLLELELTTSGLVWPVDRGGGVENHGELVVQRCTLTNNLAGRGGAIDNRGVLALADSDFLDNWAAEGGGIWSTSGSAISTGVGSTWVRFERNVADFGRGGAISIAGSADVDLEGFLFDDNRAETLGGAVASRASLTLRDSVFTRNSALTEGGAIALTGDSGTGVSLSVEWTQLSGNAANFGGAIATQGEVATTVLRTTFSDNHAELDGGALALEGSLLALQSVFLGNDAGRDGGAVSTSSHFAIVGALFEGNVAGNTGGGVAVLDFDGALTSVIDSCTFTGNLAAAGGGALLHQRVQGETVLVNSTLWNDYAGAGSEIFDGAGGGALQLANTTLQSASVTPNTLLRVGAGSVVTATNSLFSGFLEMQSCSATIGGRGNRTQRVNPTTGTVSYDASCGALFAFGEALTGFADPTAGVPLLSPSDVPIGHLADDDSNVARLPVFPLDPACNAVDKGVDQCPNPALGGSPLTHDQIFQPRPVGAACDIGPFELQ